MRPARPTVQHALTELQAQLLARHKGGLLKAASRLAMKNGMAPTDILFVLADSTGRIGGALRAVVPVASIGPVVLPGRATDLHAWVARLAIHGPIWDLRGGPLGIPVLVIDEHDAMAVVRLNEHPQ
jgi:hypothetical protein